MQIKSLFLFLLFFSAKVFSDNTAMSFVQLPPTAALTTLYQIQKRAFVADDSVNSIKSGVTLNIPSATPADAANVMKSALTRFGFVFENRGNYDFVTFVGSSFTATELFSYQPQFIKSSTLASQLTPFILKSKIVGLRGQTFSQDQLQGESAVEPQSGNGAALGLTNAASTERLLIFGPKHEIELARTILKELDRMPRSGALTVSIYDYINDSSVGSALKAVVNLASSLKINIGENDFSNFVSLDISDSQLLLSALDTNSSFRQLSKPTATITSGKPLKFFSGLDARLPGQVVLDKNGNPVKSLETISAGLNLEITGDIQNNGANLSVNQTSSALVAIDRISRREITTTIFARPGRTYVLAGLSNDRDDLAKSSFFHIPFSKQKTSNKSNLVIFLTFSPDKSND